MKKLNCVFSCLNVLELLC